MKNRQNNHAFQDLSLGRAALIAGLGLLLMVLTAPVAEMYFLPKLVDYSSAETTLQNISDNKQHLIAAIFLYFITFIADVIVAWALYVFFIPVNKSRSLLTAWFRIVYTALAIVGLSNLSKVLTLMKNQDVDATQVLFYIRSFRHEWGISLIFFAIYLILLGFLAYRATYVPKIMGILLIIGGIGYMISSLQPYFYPGIDTSIIMITYFGELVFMVWLLVRGYKVKLYQEEGTTNP